MRSGEGFNPLRSFQSQADERTPLPLGLGDDHHGRSVFQDHGVSANVNEHGGGGGWSACAWRCRGAGGSGSGAGGAAAARALSARPGKHGGAAVCPNTVRCLFNSIRLPASFSLVYCNIGRVFIYLILYSVITIVG